MKINKHQHSHHGFTIVELLIVIVIIAILATLILLAYIAMNLRAQSSAASAGLVQAKRQLETYKVDHGSYPSTGHSSDAGVTNGNVSYQYTSDGSSFCLTGTIGSTAYNITDISTPATGVCMGHATPEGTSTVTNLAINPSFESNLSGVGTHGTNNGRYTSFEPYSGSYCLVATHADASSIWGPPINVTQPGDITPGTRYYASVMVKTNVNRTLAIEWIDSSEQVISSVNVDTLIVPAPGWHKMAGSAVAPANTSYMRLTLYSGVTAKTPSDTNKSIAYAAQTASANKTVPPHAELAWLSAGGSGGGSGTVADGVVVDAIMVTAGNSANFADGNSSGWSWNGTANNSTSTGPAL